MDRKGFTLIELVMVLVLVGILAAVVIPRLGNMTTTNAGAFTDKLRADILCAEPCHDTRETDEGVFQRNRASPGDSSSARLHRRN